MPYYGKRDWLRDIRYKKRWSQARTALEAGMSQSQYSRIEIGYCEPTIEMKYAIAQALGFDADKFDEYDMSRVVGE